ncbi:hypothetical protein D3C87_78610 [compost metagenome]
MKRLGLDCWEKIDREEIKFPLQEFDEKIDSLVILNLLVGLEVDFTKHQTEKDLRFSINIGNDDFRLNIMLIEKENKFESLRFSFYALMSTPLYKYISRKHGLYNFAESNNDIRNLLNSIENILNDINEFK